ncbi:hypothetical protein ACFSTD_07115 [Novosphingobium colocasiae]|nr:hypothetical protein [Novosphingobium colocasiae]
MNTALVVCTRRRAALSAKAFSRHRRDAQAELIRACEPFAVI